MEGEKRLLSIATDITERKQQEKLMQKKQSEFEAHALKLEQMNTALNVLIDHRKSEKEGFKKEITTRFEKLVFPYFSIFFKGKKTRKNFSLPFQSLNEI